jgi:hypothetical protein
MENFKFFTLGFIMSMTIIILYFIISTDNYIRHDVVNKVELDSILDARLGSGCDLSMDSCDAQYY